MIVAAAVAPAIAFAPPLDRAIRYEVVERRPTPTGDAVYRMWQTVRFDRTRDGYLLAITPTSYTLAAPAARRSALRAAVEPIIGSTVRIRLSSGGVPTGVVDGAATWDRFVNGVRAMAARDPGDQTVARVAAALAALPPAARDAQLIENADGITAPRLPPLAIGQVAADGDATVARLADDAGDARFRRLAHRPAPGGGTMEIEDTTTICRADGIVRRRTRSARLLRAGRAATPISRSETILVP